MNSYIAPPPPPIHLFLTYDLRQGRGSNGQQNDLNTSSVLWRRVLCPKITPSTKRSRSWMLRPLVVTSLQQPLTIGALNGQTAINKASGGRWTSGSEADDNIRRLFLLSSTLLKAHLNRHKCTAITKQFAYSVKFSIQSSIIITLTDKFLTLTSLLRSELCHQCSKTVCRLIKQNYRNKHFLS